MQWRLTSGSRTVARGSLAAVIAAGVDRELVQRERYPARKTGDDVTKFSLQPGVRIVIVPSHQTGGQQ